MQILPFSAALLLQKMRCYQGDNYGWHIINFVFIYLSHCSCCSILFFLNLLPHSSSPLLHKQNSPSIMSSCSLLSWESIKSHALFQVCVSMTLWTSCVPTNTEKHHRRLKTWLNCSDWCTQSCFSSVCSSVWFNLVFILSHRGLKHHLKEGLEWEYIILFSHQ